jgi:hypothetical protein
VSAAAPALAAPVKGAIRGAEVSKTLLTIFIKQEFLTQSEDTASPSVLALFFDLVIILVFLLQNLINAKLYFVIDCCKHARVGDGDDFFVST